MSISSKIPESLRFAPVRATQKNRILLRTANSVNNFLMLPPSTFEERRQDPTLWKVLDACNITAKAVGATYRTALQPLFGTTKVDVSEHNPEAGAGAKLWNSLRKHGIIGSTAKLILGKRSVHLMDAMRLAVVTLPSMALAGVGIYAALAFVGLPTLAGVAVGLRAPVKEPLRSHPLSDLSSTLPTSEEIDALHVEADAAKPASVLGDIPLAPASVLQHKPESLRSVNVLKENKAASVLSASTQNSFSSALSELPNLSPAHRKFVREIREPGTWGGELEIAFLAKVYNANIRVWQRVPEQDGAYIQIQQYNKKASKVVDIAYDGSHYNAMQDVKTHLLPDMANTASGRELPVPGDGDCVFHAVAEGLHFDDLQLIVAAHRHGHMDELRQNEHIMSLVEHPERLNDEQLYRSLRTAVALEMRHRCSVEASRPKYEAFVTG